MIQARLLEIQLTAWNFLPEIQNHEHCLQQVYQSEVCILLPLQIFDQFFQEH